MTEYIIWVIYAIDMLCNFWFILMLFVWNKILEEKLKPNKFFYLLIIIFILGIIFIPNKETLYILLK